MSWPWHDPWWYLDDAPDLDDHHPPCPGGCGELADECMCSAPWSDQED